MKNLRDFYNFYRLPISMRVDKLKNELQHLNKINGVLGMDLKRLAAYWMVNWKVKKNLTKMTFEDLEGVDANDNYTLFVSLQAYLLNKNLIAFKKEKIKELEKSIISYEEYRKIHDVFIQCLKESLVNDALIFEFPYSTFTLYAGWWIRKKPKINIIDTIKAKKEVEAAGLIPFHRTERPDGVKFVKFYDDTAFLIYAIKSHYMENRINYKFKLAFHNKNDYDKNLARMLFQRTNNMTNPTHYYPNLNIHKDNVEFDKRKKSFT